VTDKDRAASHRLTWEVMSTCFTALRHKANLAGRSRREAQGSAKVVGVRYPNPAEGHPPVPPVDFAPSLNRAGSCAHARCSLAVRAFLQDCW